MKSGKPVPIRVATTNNDKEEATVTKWEYATVPIIPHASAEILSNWGDEGWELVCVFSPPDVGGVVAYFKRPKA